MTAIVDLCRAQPRLMRDMTVRQLALLTLANLHPGNSCEFYAAELDVSKPVVSRACRFLTKLGLLSVRREADDKRRNIIAATEAGAVLVGAIEQREGRT